MPILSMKGFPDRNWVVYGLSLQVFDGKSPLCIGSSCK
jgi:hypothetical protein